MDKNIPRIGGLTWKQIVDAIQTCPTVSIWPIAGPALGYRSKSASYDAASKGFIKVLEQGRKRPVPTPWLRHVLGLDEGRRQRRRKETKRRPKRAALAFSGRATGVAEGAGNEP